MQISSLNPLPSILASIQPIGISKLLIAAMSAAALNALSYFPKASAQVFDSSCFDHCMDLTRNMTTPNQFRDLNPLLQKNCHDYCGDAKRLMGATIG